MKTKTIRQFEVGDAFLLSSGQLLVVRRVQEELNRVVFYAAIAHFGDFDWLNTMLDEGAALHVGKLELVKEVEV